MRFPTPPLAVLVMAVSLNALSPAVRVYAQATQELDYSRLIELALTEFNASRWEPARALFRRAHALEPSARTFRAIGFASFELGDHAEAVASLTLALEDQRRALTPEQATASREILTRAEAFVGRVALALTPEDAEVELDGAPAARIHATVVATAGAHTLTIRAEGHAPETRTVEVRVRETVELTVTLRPDAPAPTPEEDGPAEPISRGSSWRAPVGWSLVGLGGASLLIGVVTGIRGQGIHDDLDAVCPEGACPAAYAGDIDRGRALVNSSTAFTGLTIAAGASGLVLLLLERERTRHEEPDTTPEVEATAGPGNIGLGARVRF